MTNWQDKYKDLEIGQSAWYWHKDHQLCNSVWSVVMVQRITSMQDGCSILIFHSIYNHGSVSENYPNGPKCITPDEMIENSTEELDKYLPPGCYDTCANCGFWHYTHANSSCKNFVKKEKRQ